MKETLNTTEKSAAMPTAGALTPATTYKDRIFRMISGKREFLDLIQCHDGTTLTQCRTEADVTTLVVPNANLPGHEKTTSPSLLTTHFPCTSTRSHRHNAKHAASRNLRCMYPTTYIPVSDTGRMNLSWSRWSALPPESARLL